VDSQPAGQGKYRVCSAKRMNCYASKEKRANEQAAIGLIAKERLCSSEVIISTVW
jgi:hypothetical protein